MAVTFTHELAAALVRAQGVSTTAESAADDARFVALVLERSANAFSRLAFEDEPAGFAAAQRRAAP
jgi:hypothetical protein